LRCEHCQCTLRLGNYASMQRRFYCKPHFKQLFALKGNYDTGFGREEAKRKWDSRVGLGYGPTAACSPPPMVTFSVAKPAALEGRPAYPKEMMKLVQRTK
jgi:hypothetical protein